MSKVKGQMSKVKGQWCSASTFDLCLLTFDLRSEATLARPAGFEPAAFGSGGSGQEATGGSVEPLPLILLAFRQTPDNPKPPRDATRCQSFVSRGSGSSTGRSSDPKPRPNSAT